MSARAELLAFCCLLRNSIQSASAPSHSLIRDNVIARVRSTKCGSRSSPRRAVFLCEHSDPGLFTTPHVPLPARLRTRFPRYGFHFLGDSYIWECALLHTTRNYAGSMGEYQMVRGAITKMTKTTSYSEAGSCMSCRMRRQWK